MILVNFRTKSLICSWGGLSDGKRSDFWAVASGAAVTPIAIVVGAAKGVYDAVSGSGPFSNGFEQTASSLVHIAEEFGAEHGETITNGLVSGAAAALGGRVVNEALGVLRKIKIS